MFICEFCGMQQPSGVKPTKIPTKVNILPLPPAQKEVDNLDRVSRIDKKWVVNWPPRERRILQDDWPRKLIVVYSREERRVIEEKDACPSCAVNPPEPELVKVIIREEAKC